MIINVWYTYEQLVRSELRQPQFYIEIVNLKNIKDEYPSLYLNYFSMARCFL